MNGKFSAQKLLSVNNRRSQFWLGRKQDEQPGHKDTEAPDSIITVQWCLQHHPTCTKPSRWQPWGLQKALPIITMLMITFGISFWGQETQHFLWASPCPPLLLEVLKLAWATLPASQRSPRGQVRPRWGLPTAHQNKGITCNSWSPKAELAQAGYRIFC